jgi:hypothetical protein
MAEITVKCTGCKKKRVLSEEELNYLRACDEAGESEVPMCPVCFMPEVVQKVETDRHDLLTKVQKEGM